MPPLLGRWKAHRWILYGLVLFLVNLGIAGRLFRTEFHQHMGSNEGSFMAISRFLIEHWPDIDWFPWWFCGMPIENSYTPLLQWLDAGVAVAFHCSTALAFHAVTAFFYCLGPVLLALFAWRVSGYLDTAFAAGLTYSLVPFSVIFRDVYADTGGWRHARRLQTLAQYGEGGHTVILSLLPLALLFAWYAIRSRRRRWYVAFGVAFAALVLTNAFGAAACVIGTACLVLAHGARGLIRSAGMLTLTALIAYCWISPWLPPSLLQTIRVNSQHVGGDFRYTAITWAVLAASAIAFLGIVFVTRTLAAFDRFTISLAYWFTLIPSLARFGIALVPQPARYHVEMEFALALLTVFLARHIVARSSPKVRFAVCLIFTAILARQFVGYHRYAVQLIQPIDIGSTIEYKIAKWAGANLPGQRLFVSDEAGTWFNVFADNPQMNSGHDPFSPNWVMEVVTFAIYYVERGPDHGGENAVLWLRAFGVDAITVPGARSREIYKPFRDPGKFSALLPAIWHEEDDTIYAVPRRHRSLAHVVPEAAIVQRPPESGLDTGPTVRYVAALEDAASPAAEFRWKGVSSAAIVTTAQPGQSISVQVTYDRGWRAWANGRAVPIEKDGLGLMALHPNCAGPCNIELYFDGGVERRVCRYLSEITTLAVLVWLISGAWRRRKSPAAMAAINSGI